MDPTRPEDAPSSVLAAVAGIVLGPFPGYYGGWIDEVLVRIAGLFLAFPFILLSRRP
jgi:ABC-type dipeptide/oligopeptide/nickel transport system permease subunit